MLSECSCKGAVLVPEILPFFWTKMSKKGDNNIFWTNVKLKNKRDMKKIVSIYWRNNPEYVAEKSTTYYYVKFKGGNCVVNGIQYRERDREIVEAASTSFKVEADYSLFKGSLIELIKRKEDKKYRARFIHLPDFLYCYYSITPPLLRFEEKFEKTRVHLYNQPDWISPTGWVIGGCEEEAKIDYNKITNETVILRYDVIVGEWALFYFSSPHYQYDEFLYDEFD
jgi:hypothetical protein